MKVRIPLDVRLLALCTTYILLPVIACPTQCMCKWKNGKRYVECIEKDLKQIPNSLDSETQVLEFTGNDLQVLQKETFQKLGLLDLQKIYVPRCRIHKVDNHAFKGLANLVELDLSYNYLTVVPSSNFVYFPSLMRLSLNNNPITTVKTHCFQHLSYLNTLELSDCEIELIEHEAFSGLNHLEWLRLDGNKLSNMQGDGIFPDTLRGIELQNNNWNCDCNLKNLHDWIQNFNMPHTVEPVCSLPERLQRRKISSILNKELACVPEMSPTSVYLETNEGNNITLVCQVKAIPEAKISWWFHGHILQNDSVISPGFRLIYYLEEGTVDKKSELFILNINNEDNGTYSCMAENPAGKAQTNYTIRIIVKEEPVIIVVTFPQKHIVVIITGVFLIIVLVLSIIAVVLLKFRSDTKTRKKKEIGKDVALRNRNIPTTREGSIRPFDNIQPKTNGNLIINAQTHHVLHYTLQGNVDYDGTNDMYSVGNIKNYPDRNPDLINDAESVTNNIQNENALMSLYSTANTNPESFEEETTTFVVPPVIRQVTWQDQQKPSPNVTNLTSNNMYQHSADVHLNPGCFLDSEGYPYDYGLPKIPCRTVPMHTSYASGPFYQTLPHNRNKVQKIACKFAKDNEFNTTPCSNVDFNSSTVRHTLEGYPYARNRQQIAFVGNGTLFYTEPNFVPSPPEGYKSEPVAQCCSAASAETCNSWINTKGTCAVMVPMNIADSSVARCYHVETRCVDTQTSDGRLHSENPDTLKPLPQVLNAKSEPEICSESPDEGYVGEVIDPTDT